MKQYDAVIKVMESKGGYATLGYLYGEALKVPGVEWKTRTPFASIRRIVQDERYFFKIWPGLWALNDYKGKLPPEIYPSKKEPERKRQEYSHTYYQGLLVEIGNLKKLHTYVPNQDKNKIYMDRQLGELASINDIYCFTYDHIVKKARTIDVIWFNSRKMPSMLFEVEHTADIYNSLIKFVELQDFYTDFYIVAPDARKNEFESKLSLETFVPVKKRTKFMDYDSLSEWHSKVYEVTTLEKKLFQI